MSQAPEPPRSAEKEQVAPCGHPWPDPEDFEPYAEGDAWMYNPNAPRCACGRYPSIRPASTGGDDDA